MLTRTRGLTYLILKIKEGELVKNGLGPVVGVENMMIRWLKVRSRNFLSLRNEKFIPPINVPPRIGLPPSMNLSTLIHGKIGKFDLLHSMRNVPSTVITSIL